MRSDAVTAGAGVVAAAPADNLMIAPLISPTRPQFDMFLTPTFRQRGYVVGEISVGGQRAAAGTPTGVPSVVTMGPTTLGELAASDLRCSAFF